MAMTVDAAELMAFAARTDAVTGAIARELRSAGTASGLAMQQLAQSLISVKSGTGKALTLMKPVEVRANGVTVTVASSARSSIGFPYPWVIEEGHGVIYPRRGKYLRFEVDGKVVFAKKVRAVAGRPFMQPALDRSTPFVLQQFEQAFDRALASWVGR